LTSSSFRLDVVKYLGDKALYADYSSSFIVEAADTVTCPPVWAVCEPLVTVMLMVVLPTPTPVVRQPVAVAIGFEAMFPFALAQVQLCATPATPPDTFTEKSAVWPTRMCWFCGETETLSGGGGGAGGSSSSTSGSGSTPISSGRLISADELQPVRRTARTSRRRQVIVHITVS